MIYLEKQGNINIYIDQYHFLYLIYFYIFKRTNPPNEVLSGVKSIISICKSITDQVDQCDKLYNVINNRKEVYSEDDESDNSISSYEGNDYEVDENEYNNHDQDHDNEKDDYGVNKNETVSNQKINELKVIQKQYALCIQQLLQASKGYVCGSGFYPLSLLDAAAGHLTNIIIDLVRLVGVAD